MKDTPADPLENAVVYNTVLDELTPDSDIRLIVIGDNPGKDEQLNQNRKYLVGQSGKVANSFLASHAELGIDFRKNVIILKKPLNNNELLFFLGLCPFLSSQYEMNFVSRACRISNSFISFAHWALRFSPFAGWRKSSAPPAFFNSA